VTWTSRPDRLLVGAVRSALVGLGWRSGQGIVEYGLILALSATVTVVVLVFLGPTLADVLEVIGKAIDAASRSS
jgi:Flp pilus assembly pilin Flp